VLVLGGAGQVGRAVVKAAPVQHVVIAKPRTELDISDAVAVARALDESGAEWIVNAAAYTAVDLAEVEPERALAINDTAVSVLAQCAADSGCRLLQISTDFVFDGASNRAYLPTDPTSPLSVYGATKLGGEHQALSTNGGIVLRTAWVYAAQGQNFVLTMLRLMRERDQLRVVSDQIGSPTWATSVAQAIWGLIGAAAPGGIYHWTDLGLASWYDFAVAIQDEALHRGLLTRAARIVPIATSEYPSRAKRPAFSVLNTEATRVLLPAPAQYWRHNLRKMLDELRAA
jgi:dTDP-4-dehydrorhamnose reductase